jgi:3-oxoacyl-[acyl-carrier-protein] synthase-3
VVRVLIDTSDEWIRDRTGIRERHFAVDGQTTSDLATEAAGGRSTRPGSRRNSSTSWCAPRSPATRRSPRRPCGCSASSASPAPAFDVNAACAGFSYGMSTATAFIESGQAETVLVAGAEILSRVMNFEDRTTCVLFGDGAGAVVLRVPRSRASWVRSWGPTAPRPRS